MALRAWLVGGFGHLAASDWLSRVLRHARSKDCGSRKLTSLRTPSGSMHLPRGSFRAATVCCALASSAKFIPYALASRNRCRIRAFPEAAISEATWLREQRAGLRSPHRSQALAQKPPLLPEKDVAALANELSGETAKRNLEGIARFHRQRGSQGFHSAAELVAERLRAYGLSDVAILQFPADGKIFYGTQRSRPALGRGSGGIAEVVGKPRSEILVKEEKR